MRRSAEIDGEQVSLEAISSSDASGDANAVSWSVRAVWWLSGGAVDSCSLLFPRKSHGSAYWFVKNASEDDFRRALSKLREESAMIAMVNECFAQPVKPQNKLRGRQY